MSQMRSLPNLGLLAIFFVVSMSLALFFRYFVLGTPVVTYKDDIIAWGTVHRPLDTLAVHSGSENFIRVDGRIYRRVRGLPPFYLRLPLLHSILFVTDVGNDRVDFHFVKLESWTEVIIHGERLSFGGHIGDPNPPGSAYTDYVDKEAAGEIVLATRYPHARTRVFLDLPARKVTKVDYDEFDDEGRIKIHRVYVNGRQVE